MNQLAASLPPHSSKKNKILAALGAVIVGHAAILFVLSQMSPSQLKPLTPPKPIQVRIIQQEKQPEKAPPKPVEPPKPKEVKIVDTPPPPPKKVEQVQQVKKETPKPKVAEPPKPTKVEAPTPVVTPVVVVETPKPVVQKVEPAPKPTPVVETPPAPPAPAKPAVDMTPRNLGNAAGVEWSRTPKPKLMVTDLEKVTNNMVVLRMDVDEKGKIQARVVQSSGSPKVDREMVRAVQAARFQAYKENGVAVPFYAEQSFRVQ